MVARFHYDDEVLNQLLRDNLSQQQSADIFKHVEACESCQSRLESISLSDEVVEQLRTHLSGTVSSENIPEFHQATWWRTDTVQNEHIADHEICRLPFLQPAQQADSLGRFDRYEIKQIIGRGGMGIVMRGIDTALARECAIKVLSPELATNATARQRFFREAKSAAAVVHEHVIPIQTVNEENGLPYLVMPLIDGVSLQQRVSNSDGPLELLQILRIGMQAASGLAAAHEQGLVHRDVKPANIMLENGVERVLIADFGLARAADDANMTRSQVIAGTPQYMSPEQARGDDIDRRSDLFSLGSVLYFMCCGHSPFRASTTMGVLNRIGNDSPRSIRQQNPSIPDWLEAIVFKLLAKDPEHRFQSAQEVSLLFGRWLAHLQQPEEYPAPQPQRPDPSSSNGRSNRWLFWGAAAAILLAAISPFLFLLSGATGPDNPFDTSHPGYANVSPFTGFVWRDGNAQVLINQNWYQLQSFNGLTLSQMFEKCEQENWDAKKRIREDHAQLARIMGTKVGDTTDVELINETGRVVALKNMPMSKQNRAQLLRLSMLMQRNPFTSSVPGYPKRSPFSGLHWKAGKPQVLVDDEWYELVSVHGVTFEEIQKRCRREGWSLKQRFRDDLVQILRLMGQQIDDVTDLELSDSQGRIIRKENVEMTREKLSLTQTYFPSDPMELHEDLAQFEQQLEAQFAYLGANDFDYESEIDKVHKMVDQPISMEDFAIELSKILNRFIDGHAYLEANQPARRSHLYLPFLIEVAGDRFVAVKPDRSGLVDEAFPFIHTIDGQSVTEWIEQLAPFAPAGSTQLRRYRCIRNLRNITYFREYFDLKESEYARVTLAKRDGQTSQRRLQLSKTRPVYGEWPRGKPSKILDENIGYLRIKSMDDDAVKDIREWMPEFKSTDGLIVDVRGNGGGSRRALMELAPYLMQAQDEPRIVNVAKYRLYPEFDEDHLSDARFVYRESSARFDPREQDAIAKFKQTFQPEWEPEASRFSDWHYLVLAKDAKDDRYHYDKPVIILCDDGCFSATDIFLGAFKGWPGITLMGQASGGGSARSQRFELDHSGITVRCASMASFQPNGWLYDTRGIIPDIVVQRTPECYTHDGADVVLKQAIKLLKSRPGDDE